jgi:hypothetical protein
MQEVEQKENQQRQEARYLEESKIEASALGSPMFDPTKNPQLGAQLEGTPPDNSGTANQPPAASPAD